MKDVKWSMRVHTFCVSVSVALFLFFGLSVDACAESGGQKGERNDVMLVLQGLDGSYGQLGIRYEFLQRYLGLTAQGGFYMYEKELRPVAKGKLHILPLGGDSTFSPEVGAVFFTDFRGDGAVTSAGPQLGVSWNTGLRFFTAVFIQNELRFTLTGDTLPAYFFSLGVRLF